MEPCSGAVGRESAAAASCVGGRPTGLGFGPPLATAASEASLAVAKAGLLVLFPWCLFSCGEAAAPKSLLTANCQY